jgi:hypothetical protein
MRITIPVVFSYPPFSPYYLGAFAKSRRATIGFVKYVRLSVRPSVRTEQLGSPWTDFNEVWYLRLFQKSVEKIQVTLQLDKNNGNLILV